MKKAFLNNPLKVGRPDLTRKVEIDYESIMNEDYWDSDWSISDDEVTSMDPKGKKVTRKRLVKGGSSSVA